MADVAIRYQVISETGPAHDKVFDVEVLVEVRVLVKVKVVLRN